jgi:beta-glucosidase
MQNIVSTIFNRFSSKSLPLVLLTFLLTNVSAAQDLQIERKVDNLLSSMTLKEKIGQMTQFGGINKKYEEMIKLGEVGSFLGVKGAEKINELQRLAVEKSRLGIPLIFGNDVIHGYHTTFPIPLGAAASWNPELVQLAAKIAAGEAALEGTKWTFAPMVDIARDPRWGRIAEGAGEDPYLGSVMAEAEVMGFQGNNLNNDLSIAACAKHFAAYGAAEAGRDYNTVDISERTLREVYLPPFKAAVDAGVSTLMSAFNSLNGIPASANYHILTQILRKEWGFTGFVVSDANSIGELINHGIAKDEKEAALKALTAGVDMDMGGDAFTGNVYSPNLASLVKEGKISEKLIDQSVRRILRIKFRLGLFDHPYTDTLYIKNHIPDQKLRDSAALRLAEESIVMLKNDNNLLPLRKDLTSVAVIGPLADDKYDPLGPWNCSPIPKRVTTVLDGIKNKLSPTTKIKFIKGCDIESNNKRQLDNAIRIAGQSDIVILVVGEAANMSGEAASRTNLDLPGVQEELVEKVAKVGKPTIVLLMNGRPLTIDWIAKHIPSVLECWFLGDQSGNAIANVLFGDYNPSGRLPVTFPRSVGQIPIYYDHLNTGKPFEENNKFTSKYLDSPVTPLYPFGFGLSYTTFKYENLKVEKNKIKIGGSTDVSINVTNTGKISGSEVVQLYLRDLVASVSMPVKELKGFQKIYLNPGETKTLKFIITPKMLELYDVNMKKTIEPGKCEVMIGGSSVDLLSNYFEIIK